MAWLAVSASRSNDVHYPGLLHRCPPVCNIPPREPDRSIETGYIVRLQPSFCQAESALEFVMGKEFASLSGHTLTLILSLATASLLRRRAIVTKQTIHPSFVRNSCVPPSFPPTTVIPAYHRHSRLPPSFPRRRESRGTWLSCQSRMDPRLRGDDTRTGQLARPKAGISDDEGRHSDALSPMKARLLDPSLRDM